MPKKQLAIDAEMQQFMDDLLESVRQAKRGEFAAVYTPEDIAAWRKAAQPGDSVAAIGQHAKPNALAKGRSSSKC